MKELAFRRKIKQVCRRNGFRENDLTLEQQSNCLLYDYPNVVEPGDEPEVFHVLGSRRPSARPTVYIQPKEKRIAKRDTRIPCRTCGRPTSEGSASARCRYCYRESAFAKFVELSVGYEWLVRKGTAWEFAKNAREPDLIYVDSDDPLTILCRIEDWLVAEAEGMPELCQNNESTPCDMGQFERYRFDATSG